jgi:hypothetical protein
MMNPTLADLIGGIQSVTLGDEEARRRGTQKSILERKAPPTFEVIVEIQNWAKVSVHANVAETIDAMLRGYDPRPETRQLGREGRIEIVDEPREERETSRTATRAPENGAGGWEIGLPAHRRSGGHVREEHSANERIPAERRFQREASREPVVKVLPFGISRTRLEQAVRGTGMNVEIVASPHEADAVITMRAYYRRKPQAIREAEERALPIYIIKTNTSYQMEQVLLQFRKSADGDSGRDGVRKDPMTEVFKDTEDAIARVLEEGRPIELPAANSYIRRVQHELAGRFNLDSKSAGKEPNRRVKILPAN